MYWRCKYYIRGWYADTERVKMLVKINCCAETNQVSEINAEKIWNVCWDYESRRHYKRRANYVLCGYISYEEGQDLADHSGSHGDYSGDMKVLIPASLNSKQPYREGYEYLKNIAGKKPKSGSFQINVCVDHKPCTTRILEILDSGNLERKKLRDKLKAEGYPVIRIDRALMRMAKDGRIVLHDSQNSFHKIIEKDIKGNTEFFTEWLKQEKKLGRASAYDIKSRIKRVKKILNSEIIVEKTITELDNNEAFLALNNVVRSQLKGAVKLFLEYSLKS